MEFFFHNCSQDKKVVFLLSSMTKISTYIIMAHYIFLILAQIFSYIPFFRTSTKLMQFNNTHLQWNITFLEGSFCKLCHYFRFFRSFSLYNTFLIGWKSIMQSSYVNFKTLTDFLLIWNIPSKSAHFNFFLLWTWNFRSQLPVIRFLGL